MSTPEAPIPKKFWAMVQWTIQNHPWIFFLVAIERAAERDFTRASVFGAIFVANLLVASRWDEIGGYLQRRKKMLPYLALGGLGILLLGIAVGALWNGGPAATPTVVAGTKETGRIAWNFEEAANGLGYFLGFNRQNQDEVRISGFAAHGRNTSNDPITELKGFIRSDVTNEEWPIYLQA